eukprot:Pgem_evm1s9004
MLGLIIILVVTLLIQLNTAKEIKQHIIDYEKESGFKTSVILESPENVNVWFDFTSAVYNCAKTNKDRITVSFSSEQSEELKALKRKFLNKGWYIGIFPACNKDYRLMVVTHTTIDTNKDASIVLDVHTNFTDINNYNDVDAAQKAFTMYFHHSNMDNFQTATQEYEMEKTKRRRRRRAISIEKDDVDLFHNVVRRSSTQGKPTEETTTEATSTQNVESTDAAFTDTIIEEHYHIHKEINKSLTLLDGNLACGYTNEKGVFSKYYVGAKVTTQTHISLDIKFGYYFKIPFLAVSKIDSKVFLEHSGKVSADFKFLMKFGIWAEKTIPIATILLPYSFEIPHLFKAGPTINFGLTVAGQAQVDANFEIETGFEYGNVSNTFNGDHNTTGTDLKTNPKTSKQNTTITSDISVMGSLSLFLSVDFDLGIKIEVANILDVAVGLLFRVGGVIQATVPLLGYNSTSGLEPSVMKEIEKAKQKRDSNSNGTISIDTAKVSLYGYMQLGLYYSGMAFKLGTAGFISLWSLSLPLYDWPLVLNINTPEQIERRGISGCNIVGGDLVANGLPNITTFEKCKTLCTDNKRCVRFVFSDQKKKCYLKNNTTTNIVEADVNVGQCGEIKQINTTTKFTKQIVNNETTIRERRTEGKGDIATNFVLGLLGLSCPGTKPKTKTIGKTDVQGGVTM